MIKPVAIRFVLVSIALFVFGCAGEDKSRKDSTFQDNKRARSLYLRAKKEIRKNDFTPGITDILHAEQLCSDENLMIDIVSFREDVFNHTQVFTSIEDGNTLKYTLLYKRDRVFYPIENMHIRFTFIQGDGIITESVTTNTTGTARGILEKITSGKRKIVIESVPVVIIGRERTRIDDLKRDFVLANRGKAGEIHMEKMKNIVVEAVNSSINFMDELMQKIFRSDEDDNNY